MSEYYTVHENTILTVVEVLPFLLGLLLLVLLLNMWFEVLLSSTIVLIGSFSPILSFFVDYVTPKLAEHFVVTFSLSFWLLFEQFHIIIWHRGYYLLHHFIGYWGSSTCVLVDYLILLIKCSRYKNLLLCLKIMSEHCSIIYLYKTIYKTSCQLLWLWNVGTY